jgi:hypothetical protein
MKKYLFLFLLMLVLGSAVTAQEIRPGILGGINFQNLNGEDETGDKLENELIIGFHAGVNVLIPISPEIFFQPGVLFSTKGAKVNDILVDVSYKLSYIELPLNIVYRGQLGNNFVLLGFGPYLGYAVGGNLLLEDDIKRKIEFKNVIEPGDPVLTPYLKSFDAGANIFAGYELENGFFFQLNAQLGLMNINPEDNRDQNEDGTLKNTGFGLSLGYRF